MVSRSHYLYFTAASLALFMTSTAFAQSAQYIGVHRLNYGLPEQNTTGQNTPKLDVDKLGTVNSNPSQSAALVNTQDVNAAAPTPAEKSIEQAVPQATPEWQASFLKKLVGGDGTITLFDHKKDPAQKTNDVVNIDQAVSLALANNPELKASIEALKSSYWDKMGAYSQFLPIFELDLAVGHERSRPAAFNDDSGGREPDDRHLRKDRVLTIRQPLIDLGYISDIFNSKDRESYTDFQRLDVRDTVASDTVTAYMRLIQASLSISLADQYKGYLDNLAQKMQMRVEGGGASNADLDRIISRSSLAESARVEAMSEYDAGLLEFQRLTGAMPLKIRVPDILAPLLPQTEDEALSVAFRQNPGY